MSESRPKKPRRRWLQYSLRTLLVLLTVFCVFFGWFGWTVHRANEQRKAVALVRELGGTVCYDYQNDEDGTPLLVAEPPEPKWLVQLVGVDYFHEVSFVWLHKSQPSGEQFNQIRKALPNCGIFTWPPDPSP